jgi:KDO2-lipid IV(A) lauroyltransferase
MHASLKKIIRYGYYLAAVAAAAAIRLLPYGIAVRLGGFLGRVAYALVADARRIAEENLRLSFPEKPSEEIAAIARRVFVNQGKNAFELFSFPKLGRDDILRLAPIENAEAMSKALAEGKGVLIASAHCGNWEIMAASLAQNGFPINTIARRIYIEGLNRMLVGYRDSKGVRVILRSDRDSARKMLRSLRQNETIGMLIDQDTDVPGVFVDFFGRQAWTPSGLAALALRTGAPVVLALDVRRPDGTHRVVIQGPLQLSRSGDKEKDVQENTQMITTQIERHIRNYPDQWVWIHKRWKTRPEQKVQA